MINGGGDDKRLFPINEWQSRKHFVYYKDTSTNVQDNNRSMEQGLYELIFFSVKTMELLMEKSTYITSSTSYLSVNSNRL